MNKNKRGMEKEIVKIILAVIAIILILIPLAIKVYQTFYAGHTETEQAKAILKQVSGKINAMQTVGSVDSMIFAGPQSWILFAENKDVCVCKNITLVKCDQSTKACIPLINKKASVFGTAMPIYLTEAQFKLIIQNGEEIVEITQKPASK